LKSLFYCRFHLQPFSNWMDGAKEDLVDMFIVHTVEEIQVYHWCIYRCSQVCSRDTKL